MDMFLVRGFGLMTLSRFVLGAVALSVGAVAYAAEPMVPEGPVSFYKDVRPIFQQHCQGCHQPAKAQGAYVMTSYADLLKVGDSGKPGVTPGKPEASYLLEEILVKDNKAEMPKNGAPLTKVQYGTIEKWIKEGAKDDTPSSAKAALIDADHPPKYSAPPVITSLAFSPDGKFLAVTGYHEILLYDAESWKLSARLVGLSERVQSVAWSPDGKSLAAAAGDPGRFGEVQVWDVAKKKLTISTPISYDTLFGLSWSPDGNLIAVGCTDNNVRAINTSNGKLTLQMGTHSDWVLATVFSQDSQHLASVSRDMSMKLTEVSTQRFVDNVTSITPNALKGGLMAIDRRPLKTKTMAKVPNDTPNAPAKVYDELLAAGSDGVPRLYKMHREVKREIGDDANKLKQFEAMLGRISMVKFNERGTSFAAASSLDGKGEVAIFDVNAGKKSFQAQKVTGPAYAVAWHPDGYSVASAGFDGKVWIHDAMDGSLILEFTVKP